MSIVEEGMMLLVLPELGMEVGAEGEGHGGADADADGSEVILVGYEVVLNCKTSCATVPSDNIRLTWSR